MTLSENYSCFRGAAARRLDLAIISVSYILSQVMFQAFGGRFDATFIGSFVQFLDPELLRNRLAESLWYLHMEPPLFNLFTGLVLKLFPRGYAAAFEAAYLLLGLALAWAIYRLIRRLGVSRPLGLAVTVLYVFGPADMVYRNQYFYTYPVMAMLAFAALGLNIYLSSGRPAWGWFFFGLLAVISMTRSFYHPVWYLAISAGLVIAWKGRRSAVLISLAPAMLILFWMAKNYYIFGNFTLSTGLGWSLTKSTVRHLSVEEMNALEAGGELSPLARIPPNAGLERYLEFIEEAELKWHPVEALRQFRRSTGYINLNHLLYIPVARGYERDAFTVIRRVPAAYLRGVRNAAAIFFYPVPPDHFHGQRYYCLWGLLAGSVCPAAEIHEGYFRPVVYPGYVCWVIVFLFLLAPAIFVRDLVRRDGFARWGAAPLITLAFMAYNVLYVTVAGILLDCGENNRFRAEIVPLTVVLGAVMLQRIVRGRPDRDFENKREGRGLNL